MSRRALALRRRLAGSGGTAPPGPPNSTLRDPWLEPFSSSWYGNMPIGSEADLVPAGITQTSQAQIRTDGVNYATYTTDPLVNFERSDFYYRNDANNTVVRPGLDSFQPSGIKFRAGADLNGDGHMNEICVAQDQFGRLWEGQPLLYDPSDTTTTDAKVRTTIRMPFLAVRGTDVRADPSAGGHGGTGMTAFGLTIRKHEWLRGEIKHALALNVPPSMLSPQFSGYRTPALRADGGYNDPQSNNQYTGSNSNLRAGALLTWAPGFSLSSVTDPYGRMICEAIYRYGVYIVDVTGTASVLQFSVERSIEQDWLNRTATFSPQLWPKFTQLQIVNNNGPLRWGGGGTLRATMLPDLAPA